MANTQQETVPVRRRALPNMRPMVRFGAKTPSQPNSANTVTTINIGTGEPVELFVAKTPERGSKMFFYLMNEARSDNVPRLELCSLICSMFTCVWPNLEIEAKNALTNLGATVNTVKEDENGEFYGVVGLGPELRLSQNMLIFAQCIFLLYKNITDKNYENFIDKRLKALRAHIGLPEDVPVAAFLSLSKARTVRAMLGAQTGLRKAVLRNIMALSDEDTTIGRICGHLYQILSWTEMAGMLFVLDSLARTQSPVLRDKRIAGEVMAFSFAAMEVNKHEYPQFFRILEPASKTRMLERSNFPNLLTVAQLARGDYNQTLKQFVTPVDTGNNLVTELLRIHRKHMLEVDDETSFENIIEHMTDFSLDAEDD